MENEIDSNLIDNLESLNINVNILNDTTSASTLTDSNVDTSVSTYDIFYNIYTIVSVLTFSIIVIFLFKYLKSVFKFRK